MKNPLIAYRLKRKRRKTSDRKKRLPVTLYKVILFLSTCVRDIHVICKSYFSIAYSKNLNGSTIPSQIRFIELIFDVILPSLSFYLVELHHSTLSLSSSNHFNTVEVNRLMTNIDTRTRDDFIVIRGRDSSKRKQTTTNFFF